MSPWVIGIDAGATKTAAVLGTLAGDVVDRLRTAPSAIVGLPDARPLAVLRDVVERLSPDRSKLAHVAIGLSGVDFPDEFPEQHRRVADAIGVSGDKLLLVNDSVVALAGAATHDRATLVQHGTEVTMAWRQQPGAEKVFDSVGIADCFDLRLRTVPLIARMLDGRIPETALMKQVLAHCGVSGAAFPRWVVRDPEAREQILKVGPVVFAAWQAGDAAARLVEAAIDDYVLATVAMAARMGGGAFQACFGGGTIDQGGPALIAAISAQLARHRPDATLSAPAARPEDGALHLARRAANAVVAR
jgi:N-acetylglucosamine kinase-like BadF-type ATPase